MPCTQGMIAHIRLAFVLALVGACLLPEEETVKIDTGTAPPPDTQTIELAGSVAPPIDTPRVLRQAADPPRPDTSGAPDPRAAELDVLAKGLTIPVAGVKAEDLLDTFDDLRGTRTHEALDIPAPRGTPVLSATDGKLLRLYTSERGGLMIYAADASERFILMYAHLEGYADGMRDGVALRRGQVIGYVGTTGNAPPNLPHLHFAIARSSDVSKWWQGTPVDPYPLLSRPR
jgi:murein DD-endopeptidase MepM/ murein hydrolase activator NlpD